MVQRTDPQIKRTQLEAWFRGKLPAAESISVGPLEKAPGGYGSEIHFFDLNWRESGQEHMKHLLIREESMVFRVFPEFHLDREFNTMRALEGSDVPVPRMFWLETDDSVLGAPFYIMGKVDGEVLDPQQFGDEPAGPLWEATPNERRNIWRQVMQVMARINTVDCAQLGLFYPGAPQTGAEVLDHQMDFYRNMAEWAKVEPRPLIEAAFQWFDDNRVEPRHVSLCWGDARPGNLMYRDGEIVAVLDWDMTHIGTPEIDLAWFLAVDWLTGDSSIAKGRWEGIPVREETIQMYQSALGRELENLFYYEAFALLKLGIIFWRVIKNIPGIPPDYSPDVPPLTKMANMLGLERLI
jgi:aminoglycoside phosphotransferase (APT) family kinase protein